MASISREKNGRKTIQFVGPDKRRRSVRLGKVPEKMALAVKIKIEHLVAATVTGHALDDETGRWVARLEDGLADKLAAVGLIPKRQSSFLGDFLDSYIASRIDIKPNTRRNYERTQRNLIDYFGRERRLRDITAGDADDWRRHLLGSLSDATASRRTKRAKQFFAAAVRKKLITENPLADFSAPAQVNTSRAYYITRETAQKVIDACPDAEWRLIFALSRYGGLRCPSEHLSLRWGDVDWERNRIRVRSPKTEHHPGGESRIIPLFPELRLHLEQAFDQAEPGSEYVCSTTTTCFL